MNMEQWLAKLLSLVNDVADEEYQKRVWIEGKGPEASSFDEDMCMIFDDYRLDEFIAECQEKGLYAGKIDKLELLRKALDKFIDKTKSREDPRKIISNPDWVKIREMAGETLRAFGFNPKSAAQI